MNLNSDEVLSALHRAKGKGLSLKQLAGQLHAGRSNHQQLRRSLTQLLKEGRASYDGHVYREAAPPAAPREEHKPVPRRAPAAMVEGARARREQQKDGPAKPPSGKPGAQVTGVIHLKQEGYGFV